MRPYKLTLADGIWYDLTFAGNLLRKVPALEYATAAAKVLRANDLFEKQFEVTMNEEYNDYGNEQDEPQRDHDAEMHEAGHKGSDF